MRKSFFPGAWRPARRRPPSVPPAAQPLLVMFYGIILSYFAFPSSSGRAPLPPFPRSLARSFPERAREAEGDRGRGVGACSAAAAARSQVLFLSLHSSRATTTFLRRFLNLLLSCSRARDGQRQGGRERGGFVGTCSLLHSSPALPPSLPSLSVFSLIPDDSVLALMEANSIFRDCSRVIRGGGVRGRQVFCSFPTSFPLPFLSFGHFLLVEVVPCPTRS